MALAAWQQISPEYLQRCWDSGGLRHRQAVLEAIASLGPADSLLEVGCNAGVNLRLIHERWPTMRLLGVDACGTAVEYLNSSGLPASGLIGDVRHVLPLIPDDAHDIVLSCYCLAYIEPGELDDVLSHMVQIARVGIVLAEPMIRGASVRLEASIPEWAHDYEATFAGLAVRAWPVTPPVDRLNCVLAVPR